VSGEDAPARRGVLGDDHPGVLASERLLRWSGQEISA
jgi:hypothetical protein